MFDIEFVPLTSWHRSMACLSSGRIWYGHKEIVLDSTLKSAFSRIWSLIRKRELMHGDYSCEICGSGENLHIHEVWKYDDRKKTQTLVGYRVLCRDCHRVHHSSYLVRRGDIDDLVDYIVTINREAGLDIGRVYTESRIMKAYETWMYRSEFLWIINLARERNLSVLLDIAHLLLNYWIILHRKNSLDPWLVTVFKSAGKKVIVQCDSSGSYTTRFFSDCSI